MAVGYVRLWPSDPPGHADALSAQLRAFADVRGLALVDVYTEEVAPSRAGAAFSALVEALRRPHIHTLIIPTHEHFSRFGNMYRAMRTVIDIETCADAMIMSNKGGGAS